jgi:hypothetical protein
VSSFIDSYSSSFQEEKLDEEYSITDNKDVSSNFQKKSDKGKVE